jgi:Tol biopolymer transport system component
MSKLLATTVVAALLGVLLVAAATPAAAALACSAPERVTNQEPAGAVDQIELDATSDGEQVLYVGAGNPLGTNADLGDELFLYDRILDRVRQVTNLGAGTTILGAGVAMDGDAQRFVFVGDGNPLGTNADGNQELFVVVPNPGDPSGGTILRQVTTTTGGSASPNASISTAGTRVAFSSDRNLVGENADLNVELFTVDIDGSGVLSSIDQISSSTGSGNVDAVDISGDGGDAVFHSTTNRTGQNADGSTEVFRAFLSSESVTQVTNLASGFSSTSPEMDETGTRIVFRSDGSFTGAPSNGGSEIFVRDLSAGTFTRISDDPSFAGEPEISLDGQVVVWESSTGVHRRAVAGGSDLVVSAPAASRHPVTDTTGSRVAFSLQLGSSADELLLATCADPTFVDVGVNHPFFAEIEWMAAEEISEGFQPGPQYQPSAAVSRQAMSAFLFRLADVGDFDPPGVPTFIDVRATNPFFTEIEWMAATGISEGTLPGPTYRPSSPVSRGAMSAFMFRLANTTFPDPPTPTFTDVATTHPFFTEIEWMAFRGVTTGFQPGPTYRPSSPVSRQAMSAFMQRLGERVPFVPVPPVPPSG